MSVRFEKRIVTRHVGYAGQLGYLWCLDCAPHDDRQEPVHLDQLGSFPSDNCDECGIPLSCVPGEPVYEEVEIEYTPCRIF